MKPMTIQKIIGIIIILCGVAAAWFCDWDITNLLIAAPFGLICLFSKQNIIGIVEEDFTEYIDEEDKEDDKSKTDPTR